MQQQQQQNYPSVLGVLTVVFVIAKLTGMIAWSWWWVLSPLWIPVAVVGFITLICIAIAALNPNP